VDGRDKPGHDEWENTIDRRFFYLAFKSALAGISLIECQDRTGIQTGKSRTNENK
jgi:hypothetical protein